MNEGGWPAFLRSAMHAAGYTSGSELSRASGVGESLISRWLHGTTQPDVANLRRLVPVLRVPLLQLLVAAGHISPEEARLRAEAMRPPEPVLDELARIRADIQRSNMPKERKRALLERADAEIRRRKQAEEDLAELWRLLETGAG